MRLIIFNSCPLRTSFQRGVRAFSLIEVLVVVGLLSFIILGLMMMFSQVQRAYKLGTTQVDVLESGRMVADQLNRELVQVAPSRGSNSVNFYTELTSSGPLLQQLSGTTVIARTNVLSALFFLTQENQRWTGIGYYIADTNNVGMGILCRYETNAPYGVNPALLYQSFFKLYDDNLRNLAPIAKEMSKLVDGVVQFRVRAYDTNSVRITSTNGPNWIRSTDLDWPNSGDPFYRAGELSYLSMTSNTIPVAVEVELGILEDAVLAKARAYPTAQTRRNFLTNQVNAVHVFRTRVSLRNVDPTAYQ